MHVKLELSELLKTTSDAEVISGSTDQVISGFANLKEAIPGDLSFIQSSKYIADAAVTKASVLLVPRDLNLKSPDVECVIAVTNPSRTLSEWCGIVEALLYPVQTDAGIHPTALIGDTSNVADSVEIGPFSTIGKAVKIGTNTSIGARVSIGANCEIGSNVSIADNCVIDANTSIGDGSKLHSGVVIGTPGFGYDFNPEKGCHDAIPQVGRVVIGKYVDVGANTTIDRARIGTTEIGDGTKIDNLVQIAHNVKIGKHCILCAFVGISGSVTVGDYVVFGGRVSVADHLTIASGVQVGGAAGVMSNLDKAKGRYLGMPAMNFGLSMKIYALQRKLPDLFKRVGGLENQLSSLHEES